jgi:hypothetical protein
MPVEGARDRISPRPIGLHPQKNAGATRRASRCLLPERRYDSRMDKRLQQLGPEVAALCRQNHVRS